MPPDFPARIRRLRRRLGLSQTQLAQHIGISFLSVNRWENGKVKPSQLAWQRICALEEAGTTGTHPEGSCPPGPGTDPSRNSLIGRQREMECLQEHLEAAAKGRGHAVLIAGEAGIGKSRLLQELSERARLARWQVRSGRAVGTAGRQAYACFHEALREDVLQSPLRRLQKWLGEGAADLAGMLPEILQRLPLEESLPVPSPEIQRPLLFERFVAFLRRRASDSSPGLLLILDDLHWADPTEIRLFAHVARHLSGVPLLLVGALRGEESSKVSPLVPLVSMEGDAGCHPFLRLSPLSPGESTVLASAVARTEVAGSLAETIHRVAGGNPFFIGEIARDLQPESQNLEEAPVDEGTVPRRVRAAILARMSRLDPLAQGMLQAATVLGSGFLFDVVIRMQGTATEAALDAWDRLVASGLVVEEENGSRFAHPLILQTLTETLSLPRRQYLHRRAAEALSSLSLHDPRERNALLAYHYRLAGPAARPQALRYTLAAAAEAAAVCAWEEAADHWQRALGWMDPEDLPERCRVLLLLAGVKQKSGDTARARELYQETASLARRVHDAEGGGFFARSALGAAGVAGGVDLVDARTVRMLGEALQRLGEAPSPIRAQVLARLGYELQYAEQEREARERYCREAVETARQCGDPPTLGYVLSYRFLALWEPENAGQRLADANEIIRIGETHGERELTLLGHRRRVTVLMERGDMPAVDREIEIHQRLAREWKHPLFTVDWLLMRAMRALAAGRFSEAEPLIVQARHTGEGLNPTSALQLFLLQMLVLRWNQGRIDEMAAMLQEHGGQTRPHPGWQAIQAFVFAEMGRELEARAFYAPLAEDGFSRMPRDATWVGTLALLAMVCARMGDDRQAGILGEMLAPFRGRHITVTTMVSLGAADHFLGLLASRRGRWHEASSHFEQALAMNLQTGAQSALAWTRYHYGTLLLQRNAPGDRGRALPLLQDCDRTAQRLGMAFLRKQAGNALMRATIQGQGAGSTPTEGGIPDAPEGLTPRETEVLGYLAAGLTSRQIAQRMQVAMSTVQSHIASIYGKLGIHRRAEAVAHALRQRESATVPIEPIT